MHNSHTHNHSGAQAPEVADSVLHRASQYDLLLKLLFLGQEQAARRRMLEPAAIQPGQQVLDVGCGTGTLALVASTLAGPAGKVFGIDPSPEMIDVARRKANKTDLGADFRVGLIQDIPFSDGQFDVALSSLMFHHLADDDTKRRGLAEMRRVLKPGGRCLIIDFDASGGPIPHRLMRYFRGIRVTDNAGQNIADMLQAAGFEQVESGKLRFWLSALISFYRGSKPRT